MPFDRSSLQALRNLIADTDLILETAPDLPQNRTACSRENLRAALALMVRVLQLLPDSLHHPRHPGHGSGHCGSCVGLERTAGLVVIGLNGRPARHGRAFAVSNIG